ncbi:MAG: TetR family transcriptional regulator [Actinophytocola sp.]|uniref:TetR/AcrR family transcriptional regulator n=1 Tax=Actinophytocola sp. TaxID=1872138 RepID=UPI001328FA13|nr:TetR/AcrR family transcriptional regulator [Actinophytocola sp.]MPZ81595.1 TetR family transcriptional regulator [Actinophytocola sp.]
MAGGKRAAKAAATRARMLGAARALFVGGGYGSTSMQAIAAEAGVAVQTLYYTFETKRAILTELLDVEVAGDAAPVATLDRPQVMEAMAAPPADQLRRMVAMTAQVHARVVPLLEVLRAAAAVDPGVADLWRTNIAQRHTVQVAFAAALAAKGALRPGLSAGRAADIALAVLSPETYHLLVHERAWPRADWADWATDALTRQLIAEIDG